MHIFHLFWGCSSKNFIEKKGKRANFILILSQYGHIFSAVWLHSLLHMCREIKIRCLQNENPGSSPARPWYYAGNIKSIPRFRHLSPPKMFFSVWSYRLPVCSIVPYWLKLDVLVIGMKKSLSVDIHGRNPPFLTHSAVRLIYIFRPVPFSLEMDSVEVLAPDHYRHAIIPPGQPSHHHKWPFFTRIKHMN